MKQKPVVQEVGCRCGEGVLSVEITVHREGPLEFSSEAVIGACRSCGSTDLSAARSSLVPLPKPKN